MISTNTHNQGAGSNAGPCSQVAETTPVFSAFRGARTAGSVNPAWSESATASSARRVPAPLLSRHRSALCLLLSAFITFGVCGEASAGFGNVPSPGFPGGFPGGGFPLAGISLNDLNIAYAVVGTLGGALGLWSLFGQHIRREAGVKDTTSTTLEGQPITVRGELRMVAHHELEERLESYVTNDDLHAAELRLTEKQETNFRELDKKRSASIGNVHEHLNGTAAKIHERIEAVAATQRADMDTKIEAVRKEIHDMPSKLFTMLRDAAGFQGGKK